MRVLFCISCWLFACCCFGQTTISGQIFNEKNEQLQGATVVVSAVGEDVIRAYAISNETGAYEVNVSATLDSLQINVSFIGYAKQTKIIANTSQKLNFTLVTSTEDLKEVVIENAPITKKGDTINYAVNSFKNQKDRVIADVLKKLPGIEVLNDGKILYQGKPIQKYYIEGLDLLEGKYNLANNNLPANSVSKVQILENHQPIQLLDSLVFSDRASLNIKLKKDITVTGVARLGSGFSPFLWNVNVTPMLFSKNKQLITSYQTNATGKNISNEIKTLTLEDLLDEFENNTEKRDWVGIVELFPPSFSEKYWLDNNAHLVTANYLTRIEKDVNLKVNASYINDVQRQIGNTQTTFFTPTDTINITEITNNSLFTNALKSSLIFSKNTKKKYLKNTLTFDNYWNSQRGNVLLNNEQILQEAEIPFTNLSNKFKLLTPFGEKIITLQSIVTYTKSRQNLHVSPGQFEDIFNAGNALDNINQRVTHENIYTNNRVSFTKKIKRFTLIPKVGFSLLHQTLDSRIATFENNQETVFSEDSQNDLQFTQTSFYTTLLSQYEKETWKLALETPVKLLLFDRNDALEASRTQDLNRLIFEPKLTVKKDLNAFWKASLSMNISNDFGDLDQLYYGFILNNYRNIQRYNNPILEKVSGNTSIGFSYRNPVSSLFINSYYTYANTQQNLLFGNTVNADGTSKFGFFEQDNTIQTHSFNIKASKYFSKLKTNITLGSNFYIDQKDQFLNGILANTTTNSILFQGKLVTNLTDWLNITYENNTSISNTKFENQRFDTITNQEHIGNLNIFPSEHQFIGLDLTYYKNNISNQPQENYFLDFTYRYTFKKSKIDIELNCRNLFNSDQFRTILNNAFSYTQSSYILRPRQVLLSTKFNF
ncbi:carboxypeptidase-like protein [Kordia periserrulae]|uniref:Carboxypeptidase-like protein n=1 Tax=Kordia periserrulae TaxID=701523 RepID=A0A2T6C3R4_9FLAO|nr:carboxypeptidase-like regulatory domain-containing protein [Kordia periserrulae]PTX62960.1 carboxypeptidase-like protein [Kordia periserrulae]